jgi:anti-sigma regulatory factor (Ser/Thr protein kinase)
MGKGRGTEPFERSLLVSTDQKRLRKTLEFLVEGLPLAFVGLTERIALAVEELYLNSHTHAYAKKGGLVELKRRECFFDGKPCLAIKLSDWGEPFNPFTDHEGPKLAVPLHERKEGGLGLRLAKSLPDHLSYTRELGANVTEIFFYPDNGKKPGEAKAKEKDGKEPKEGKEV